MKIRIDKYLADMGVGSRTEIKDDIRKGLVYINGNKVKSAGEKADTLDDEVAYKENIIKYIEFEYILLNKPAGVVSATEDRKEKTVLDIIDSKRKVLFPVGRLDKDTEGLLLLTNDGILAHELLSPKKHVDKSIMWRLTDFLPMNTGNCLKTVLRLMMNLLLKRRNFRYCPQVTKDLRHT